MANKKLGYIKLYRSIQDNPLWLSDEPFDMRSAWIDLLMMANHKEKTIIIQKQSINIKKGQMWTSIEKLSAKWHWSKNKVYRYLKILENQKMIIKCGMRHGTLLTIVNYGFFEDVRNTGGTPDGTPSEPSGGTPDGTQTRMYKNDKECKEAPSATASPVLPWRDN